MSDASEHPLFVGTAGWSIPAQYRNGLDGGSHLARYASVLRAVEINSSFHRPHRRSTYQRWAETVPEAFRFSVKLPRTVTHEHRLEGCSALLDRFADEVAGLGGKLGVVLVQLPPRLAFEAGTAARFFSALRDRIKAPAACEPRHAGWFMPEAEAVLIEAKVARVAADPPPASGAETPGGWPGLTYHRLHGSPEIYRSAYPDLVLDRLSADLGRCLHGGNAAWCIFDNTAAGHALGNALKVARETCRGG